MDRLTGGKRSADQPADRSAYCRGIEWAFQRLGRHLAQRPLPGGVTLAQYLVLRELRAGRLRPSDLAGCLGVTPGTVTPLTDRLVEAGLLRRSRDPDDRRVLRLSLTDEGLRCVEAIEAEQTNAWERLLGRLSDREIATLHGLLRKILRALKGEGGEAGS